MGNKFTANKCQKFVYTSHISCLFAVFFVLPERMDILIAAATTMCGAVIAFFCSMGATVVQIYEIYIEGKQKKINSTKPQSILININILLNMSSSKYVNRQQTIGQCLYRSKAPECILKSDIENTNLGTSLTIR